MSKTKVICVGDIITKISLCKMFDGHAPTVLSDHIEYQSDRGKREKRKYKVLKELPTSEEYATLRKKRFTTTVESLIADAYSEAESLRDEMQERFENMPENLQGGDVGQRCEEAASNLDNLQQPDYPSSLGTIECVYLPSLKLTSRAYRAAEAQGMLETAKGELESILDEKETDDSQEQADIEELISELEEAISTFGDVEFPGMYG